MASAFDAAFRALRHYYRASGFPQESSTAAEAAIATCNDAISSTAKVEVGESGRDRVRFRVRVRVMVRVRVRIRVSVRVRVRVRIRIRVRVTRVLRLGILKVGSG